jgi:hypothetical protein
MTTKTYITNGEQVFQLEKSKKIAFTPKELVSEHKNLVSTLKQHAGEDPKLDSQIKEQSKELAAYKRGEKEDNEFVTAKTTATKLHPSLKSEDFEKCNDTKLYKVSKKELNKGIPWSFQRRQAGKGKGKIGGGEKEIIKRDLKGATVSKIKEAKDWILKNVFNNDKNSFNAQPPSVISGLIKEHLTNKQSQHKAPAKPESPEWREGFLRGKMNDFKKEKSMFIKRK